MVATHSSREFASLRDEGPDQAMEVSRHSTVIRHTLGDLSHVRRADHVSDKLRLKAEDQRLVSSSLVRH